MTTPDFHLSGEGAADLAPGTWLLEASAGTGKTYTIVGIVLRLVLEARIPIERCVVMTFTRAATAELRERLRRGLHRALAVVDGGSATDEPLFADLAHRFAGDAEARRHLLLAIAGLDAALIATIHGVCHRLLGDHALHAGMPLDADLDRDLTAWRTQTVHDLLRDWGRRLSPDAAAILGKALDPATLLDDAKILEQHPGLVCEGATAISPEAVVEALTRARNHFPDWREAIAAAYTQRSPYTGRGAGPANVDEALDAIARTLGGLPDAAILDDQLDPILNPNRPKRKTILFTSEELALLRASDWHRGFTDLLDLRHRARRGLAESYQAALHQRPRSGRHLHFNDLLLALDTAIDGPMGRELVHGIQERYDLVLVDEFQDTDPLQWRILRRLFGTGGHRLFLIGDPKQAIYAFRGADVHAYLAAAASPDLRHATLGVNHRSDSDLVAAVNHCFGGRADAFVEAAIRFHPVTARHGKRLRLPDLDQRPLQIWWQDPAAKVDDTRLAIARAVAAEIRRLLAKAELDLGDGKPARLRPRDIAILVRTHPEGDLIARALAEGGSPIPTVRNIRESVFAGRTAHEVAAVLAGVLAPHRDRLVRAVALTRLVGLQPADLVGETAPRLDRLVVRLRDLRAQWADHGFLAAWQGLLDLGLGDDSPRVLLARGPDGERALTDLLHLGDLLGAAEAELRLGPEALLDWLHRHLGGEDAGNDEILLRLDRDDEAVRILTIHTSKGLEFPVVFLPFLWIGRNSDKSQVFHRGHSVHWWFGKDLPEDAQEDQFREHLAETMRLAYVAVTRAAMRCYLAFAPQPHAGSASPGCRTSALAWLGTKGDPTTARADLLGLDARDPSFHASLREAFTHPGIAVLPTPESRADDLPPSATVSRSHRPVALWGERRRERWFSSYSGLIRNRPVDEPDHDQVRGLTVSDDDPLPRGARFGTALHQVFETIDFAADPRVWHPTAIAALRAHGYDDTHADRLVALVGRVLACPIPGDGTPLGDAARDRRCEVEVLLPVASPKDLAQAFARHGGRWAAYAADIADLRLPGGYFTGIIDLVFTHAGRVHLLDWKSNDLGRRGGYHAEAMAAEMRHHHYVLQEHLYAVALHRLLRRRLVDYDYDRHVGGIHYCFVRGMDASGSGWHRERPDRVLIEALDACFTGMPHGG